MKAFIIIILSFHFITLYGQEKDLNSAVKRGKTRDFFYVATPKSLTVEKFKKWAQTQNEFIIKGYKTEKKLVFGNTTDCISEVTFIPMSEKEEYQKYLASLQEKKRQNEIRDLASIIAVVGGAAYIVDKAVESIKNTDWASAYASGGSNYSSSSSTSSQRTNSTSDENSDICKKCNDDDVDIPKIITESKWKTESLYEYKELEFADGTKGSIWRWNRTDESKEKYHVPYVKDDRNIIVQNYYYKSDDNAIKALYFFKKCTKTRWEGHFIP